MEHAPVTNLECKIKFTMLDNHTPICGGTTSTQTTSRKNVVKTNAYLLNSDYIKLPGSKKKKRWKWARTFCKVEQVKKLIYWLQ